MFSWPRFYPRTRHLEYLVENALHRRASKVHFEGRIVTQEFFKLAPPDRNNCITSVSYFLQPRLCLLIPNQQSFVSVADGLMSIGHTLTPVPKTTQVLKDFSSLITVDVDFYIWYSRQINLSGEPFPPNRTRRRRRCVSISLSSQPVLPSHVTDRRLGTAAVGDLVTWRDGFVCELTLLRSGPVVSLLLGTSTGPDLH